MDDEEYIIETNHLPPIIANQQTKAHINPLTNVMFETILQTLAENNGNYAKTAKALNISRTTLYNKMKQFHKKGN